MHLADNESFDPSSLIYSHLNQCFLSSITLEPDITVDGRLMLYKGRSFWKQYIPTKIARYSVKSNMMSNSGYKSGHSFAFHSKNGGTM